MTPTTLSYLEDFTVLESDAKVVETINEDGKDIVILDSTIFYPQGGGQPYDQGTIESEQGKFKVEEVRFFDGVVKHIGNFTAGGLQSGETVHCVVNKERRELNSRIHSAGHVVDMAVHALDLSWIPGKGYHLPEGPYVEYEGNLEGRDKGKLKADIEQLCNQFIQEDKQTKLVFMSKEKMHEVCHFVPEYIPEGKPARVVMYGNFGVPCGGTHVSRLGEIRQMTIRKIKASGSIVRISYTVG